MRPGDHWKLYLPSDLAYGEPGAEGKIPIWSSTPWGGKGLTRALPTPASFQKHLNHSGKGARPRKAFRPAVGACLKTSKK